MSIDAEESVSSRARELLRDCLVWDYHGCMPLRPADDSFLPQLERYRRAGVDVVMLRVGFGDQGVEEHIRMLAALHAWLLSRPSEHVLIDGMDDVHLARSSSRLAVGFDIEGANATADQISLVALHHSLGVRWMLLADNRNNRVGGGCRDDDPSLKAFVRDVVRAMERVGRVVCLGHTGRRTAMATLSIASKPVVFSHSCCRAIHEHPRNIDDEVMRSCSATDGVVGIDGIGISGPQRRLDQGLRATPRPRPARPARRGADACRAGA